jgi:hypothetical protein
VRSSIVNAYSAPAVAPSNAATCGNDALTAVPAYGVASSTHVTSVPHTSWSLYGTCFFLLTASTAYAAPSMVMDPPTVRCECALALSRTTYLRAVSSYAPAVSRLASPKVNLTAPSVWSLCVDVTVTAPSDASRVHAYVAVSKFS